MLIVDTQWMDGRALFFGMHALPSVDQSGTPHPFVAKVSTRSRNSRESSIDMNQVTFIHSDLAEARRDLAGNLRDRLAASGAHLAVCIVIASCVLAVVYFGWYPSPLDKVCDVGAVLLLLLAVDVVLGPLLTLVIFDRRKKSLKFDIGCIAILQLGALAYGLHTVESGRPHYLVFVKDRFEVVCRVDLRIEDRIAAAGNRFASVDWFSPRIVAAEMPLSDQERSDLLFESVQGGRDVQHFPKQYRDYATQAMQAARKAQPLSELRNINPGQAETLQSAIDRSDLPDDRLRFLPIKGPRGDATMLVDASTGAIAGMVALQPWR